MLPLGWGYQKQDRTLHTDNRHYFMCNPFCHLCCSLGAVSFWKSLILTVSGKVQAVQNCCFWELCCKQHHIPYKQQMAYDILLLAVGDVLSSHVISTTNTMKNLPWVSFDSKLEIFCLQSIKFCLKLSISGFQRRTGFNKFVVCNQHEKSRFEFISKTQKYPILLLWHFVKLER